MSHFAGEHDDNHICEGFVNPACPQQRLAPGVPIDEIRRFICEYCGAPPATLLPSSRPVANPVTEVASFAGFTPVRPLIRAPEQDFSRIFPRNLSF
ncbi:hypothetical protein [uncultured Phyllobacterium sp.]|uniref:hypothetical protein n=1 Tax=uncultured Phyllobacterium sp. TaxID=253813 RepID=UPI002587ADD7|nr:hypothetical protein [uncultured Phyllobacterium sp.]